MCSISASYDTTKLRELVELNSYRGTFSHSIAYYSLKEYKFTFLHKSFGSPDLDAINIPEDHYGICHVQAPTSQGAVETSIHPAINGRSLLWHNGILKPSTIKELQQLTKSSEEWDTKLLLDYLVSVGDLNWIDGSFSCIFWDAADERLFHFRNEISPMFWDDNLSMSSTRFDGSYETPENTWIELDISGHRTNDISTFKTNHNPYYFPEL